MQPELPGLGHHLLHLVQRGAERGSLHAWGGSFVGRFAVGCVDVFRVLRSGPVLFVDAKLGQRQF